MVHSIDTIKANSIPVSITRAALKKAQLFASVQPTEEKKRQVYFNTLAVCVVNDYMQMMEIDTDLQASDSWDQVLRLAADVADLMLPGLGHLECRPVIPESLDSSTTTPICYIPPEVPEDRIGIVVVSLSPELQQATLLGFSQTVETTELAINQLQTIDDLLEYLESLSLVQAKTPIVTRLSQWLEKQFETGWHSVESVLNTQTAEPAWNFREAVTTLRRAKLIDLGSQPMAQSVVLVVEITQISVAQMRIIVEVCPSKGQTYLPAQLQLAVLDEEGARAMEAGGNSANKNIQLRFRGRPEEEFSVEIKLGDVTIIEKFVI